MRRGEEKENEEVEEGGEEKKKAGRRKRRGGEKGGREEKKEREEEEEEEEKKKQPAKRQTLVSLPYCHFPSKQICVYVYSATQAIRRFVCNVMSLETTPPSLVTNCSYCTQ